MTTTTKRETMLERIRKHGEQLLAIFPNAKERDPVKLCKRLRRLEAMGHAIGLRLCNGPEYAEGDAGKAKDAVLAQVNAILGNVSEYQPKTGAKCGCRRGVQRDNCSACEGTGQVVDFRAIRNRPKLVPVFVNLDPRGLALKIDDEWMRANHWSYDPSETDAKRDAASALPRDWGGYGLIAPDLTEGE